MRTSRPDGETSRSAGKIISIPDGIRTPVTPPEEGPVYHIVQLGPRTLGIVYQNGLGRKGSKPPGCRGARIYYGMLDAPPADQDQLPASTWATRCPHALTFRETDRGRRVRPPAQATSAGPHPRQALRIAGLALPRPQCRESAGRAMPFEARKRAKK